MRSLRNRQLNPHIAFAIVLAATCHAGTAFGEDSPTLPWSPKAAAKYLDGRADWWLGWSGAARGQGTACLSCHTSVPFALARPALGEKLDEKTAGTVEKKLIGILDKRVQNWDKILADAGPDKNPFIPFYGNKRKPSALGTEAVLNALILINFDVHRGNGALQPASKQALAHLWEQQQKNGAWLWLDFGLNPWESDGAYFGASLAALAVGKAGKGYYDQPNIRTNVDALKKFLNTQYAHQPLHHRLTVLWASSALPGILTAANQKKLVAEIHSVQETDGGWSLARLGKKMLDKGNWQSHGKYPEGVSDGYATGLVVLALKHAGIGMDDPKLKQGIAWLESRQKDGTWPASYPNRPRDPQSDIGKFMRDAATSFAILALTESVAAARE
ncbi:MAG TPA: prenyltransferase/squalene oxidase repeat-containing protein [Gemmataceae bacterium]|nr:prenyltransferase/squalene oxidase repeat-containing protein [Gemmataceae bacterium]